MNPLIRKFREFEIFVLLIKPVSRKDRVWNPFGHYGDLPTRLVGLSPPSYFDCSKVLSSGLFPSSCL